MNLGSHNNPYIFQFYILDSFYPAICQSDHAICCLIDNIFGVFEQMNPIYLIPLYKKLTPADIFPAIHTSIHHRIGRLLFSCATSPQYHTQEPIPAISNLRISRLTWKIDILSQSLVPSLATLPVSNGKSTSFAMTRWSSTLLLSTTKYCLLEQIRKARYYGGFQTVWTDL